MTDPANISLWLALIAVASFVQSAIVVAALLYARRAGQQAAQAVERFERQQLDPLLGHAHQVIGDVRAAVARARELEGDMRDTLRRTSAQVHRRVWPAMALGRAARVVFASLTRPAAVSAGRTSDSSGR